MSREQLTVHAVNRRHESLPYPKKNDIQTTLKDSNMLVQEIMSKKVLTAEGSLTVQEAVELMNKNQAGSLIVVDSGKMKGIVTERDVLKTIEQGKDAKKVLIKEIMTTDVYFVKPQDNVVDAAQLMAEKHIKKLPVISGGALVGILTATDIVASEPLFMHQLGEIFLTAKKHTTAAG